MGKIIKCTLCQRELSENDFYPSSLKRKQFQCKECSYKKYAKKSHKKYMECLKEIPYKEFDTFCGGFSVYIINYTKPKEKRYTIKGTSGYFFQSNNSAEFIDEIKKITAQYIE